MVVLARVDHILAPLTWLAAAFAVLVLFVGPKLIGAEKQGGAAAGAPTGAAATPSGKEVFVSTGCGGCHTFRAAGSTGVGGPEPRRREAECGRGRGGRDLRIREHAVVQGAPVGGRRAGGRGLRRLLGGGLASPASPALNRVTNRMSRTNGDLQAFCLFMGYTRSGHSLIGALLMRTPKPRSRTKSESSNMTTAGRLTGELRFVKTVMP